MLPAADDPRIDHPIASSGIPGPSIALPDHLAQSRQASRTLSAVTRPPSPYLPESFRRRRMMLVSVALVCLGLLGPYLVRLTQVEGSWRVTIVRVNAATILGQEFVYAMIGLGLLLITAALCWGHGMRHAGLLSLLIAFSLAIMTVLGLAAYLDIVLMASGEGSYQTHIIWTYFFAYPAAAFAFMLSLRHGARRA